jgi:transposase
MDSSGNGSTASVCQAEHVQCFSESLYQKESDMNATIVAVDLAKNIFELAVAGSDWRIMQRQRLARPEISELLRASCSLRGRHGSLWQRALLGASDLRPGTHGAHQLNALTRTDVRVLQLRQIPGVGALTSTALRAIVGDIHRFPSGRHFASWLGLTPNERSSAEKRRLGKISKQGDVYLRTLLVHGARSALLAAHRALRAGRPLDRLRWWALECERQRGHNKATVALANRIARIVWATWKYERPFDGNWSPEAN